MTKSELIHEVWLASDLPHERRFNPPRYTEFKNALGLVARRAMNGQSPISGAVKICVDVYKKNCPHRAQIRRLG